MIRFIDANGLSLRCTTTGNGGPPLVFVHEMGGALESWDWVAPAFAARHTVVAYDMRGFGLSEKPRGDFTIDDMTADLIGVLDTLAVREPAALIGGAVGGGVALNAAARHPERVRGVVALAPATGIAAARRAGIDALAEKIARDGMRDFVLTDIAVNAWPEDTLPRPPDRFGRFLALQLANDPVSLGACYRMLARSDLEDRLDTIRCPCVLVSGRHDTSRPADRVLPLAARIPNGTFREIESGHFMALQTPELVVDVIRDFLAGLSPR